MRVALYARVSTDDRDQTPETQLVALRDFCQGRGFGVVKEYVDQASANDFARRTAWRELLRDAGRKKFEAVVVFKLDRAFRSSREMHKTLEAWELAGVGLVSSREDINTTTPMGKLLLSLLAAIAEFELETIRVRVKAGMDRARRQGKHVGRPKAEFDQAKARDLAAKGLSIRRIAKRLKTSPATVSRCFKKGVQNEGQGTAT